MQSVKEEATVRVLLKLGADGHAHATDDGRTPLHRAASTGQAETVRVMVEEMGIGVDPRAVGDTTPLQWAASQGQAETVRVLVRKGADVHAQHAMGRTPLHLAAEGGHAGGQGNRKLRAKYTQYWVGLDTALAFCM